MAARSRSYLKALWVTLFEPTQANYNDVWDTHYNLTNDKIESLSATSTTTANVLAPDGAGGVEFRPEVGDNKVKNTTNDTTGNYLDSKLTVGDEFTKETVDPAANETLLIKFKGWIYNTARTFKTIISSSGITADRTGIMPDASGLMAIAGMLEAFSFGGQATGGSKIVTFSAVASFDLNDGNSQQMTLTGNLTSLSLTHKVVGGSYLIYLIQDAVGGRTIPAPDSSFGTETDNSAAKVTVANAVNIININVRPDGTTYYTIETKTP